MSMTIVKPALHPRKTPGITAPTPKQNLLWSTASSHDSEKPEAEASIPFALREDPGDSLPAAQEHPGVTAEAALGVEPSSEACAAPAPCPQPTTEPFANSACTGASAPSPDQVNVPGPVPPLQSESRPAPKNPATHRCRWAHGKRKLFTEYHDNEWGMPVHDDARLFEMLVLECFSVGLPWQTVFAKREGFRTAFEGFDAERVAAFDEWRLEELAHNKDIVRNRVQIEAAVHNAQVFAAIQQEYGSFAAYLWGWTEGEVIPDAGITSSALAEDVACDLKARGMRYIGPSVLYGYLRAVGVIDGHEDGCYLSATNREKPQVKPGNPLTSE